MGERQDVKCHLCVYVYVCNEGDEVRCPKCKSVDYQQRLKYEKRRLDG